MVNTNFKPLAAETRWEAYALHTAPEDQQVDFRNKSKKRRKTGVIIGYRGRDCRAKVRTKTSAVSNAKGHLAARSADELIALNPLIYTH